MRPLLLLCALLAMVALGCEPDSRVSRSEDAGLGTAGEQIIGGVITTDRSEVGLLLPGCTATLVENPYTVLTAAHCVAFRSCEEPSCGHQSIVFDRGGVQHTFRVVRIHSWLDDPRVVLRSDAARVMAERDIALLELERPVPASVARPARIGARDPERGAEVVVYGYGQSSRCGGGPPPDERPKRLARFRFGEENIYTWSGDSGGPLFSGDEVIRVTSFGSMRTGLSFGACVTCRHEELMTRVRAWEAVPWSGSLGPPAAGCAAHNGDCAACVAQSMGISQCAFNTATGECDWIPGLVTTNVARSIAECRGDPAPVFVATFGCSDASTCRDCMSRGCTWATDLRRCVAPGVDGVPGTTNPNRVFASECCGGAGEPVCNRDGTCDRYAGENSGTCAADCPASSCDADLRCEPEEGEDSRVCPTDCALVPSCDGDLRCETQDGEWCGTCGDCPCSRSCDEDGVCEYRAGEDARNCARDCGPACDRDGACEPRAGESSMWCPEDCGPACNRDGTCTTAGGETATSCPADCGASPACNRDGRCDAGESSAGCPSDCPPPPTCDRNGRCDPGETTASCPSDCPAPPTCDRDGRCEPGETPADCPSDCPPPPMCDRDGRCDPGEMTSSCPSDCPAPPMCDRDGRCESGETAAGCPSDCGSGLSDIAGHPAEPEINGLAMRGAIVGFADGTFRPDAEITRAELAALLAAAFLASSPAGPISFRDVPATAWYLEAVAKCVAAGYLSGYPDGRFGPDDPVTREQALVALDSGRRWSGGRFAAVSSTFTDAEGASGVSIWARDGVADAYAAGVLGNAALLRYGGGAVLLRPRARATRAEVASFIFRAL
ncbi:MAG: S-layer homology domain-containing protein [Deltaproteobacteria bacterium]